MLLKRTFSICSVLGALILFMGAGVGQSYAEEGEVIPVEYDYDVITIFFPGEIIGTGWGGTIEITCP